MTDGNVNTTKQDQSIIDCEDIQALLIEYMARELDDSRSYLVHEHLVKCAKCKAAATEVQNTLNLLHNATVEQTGIPTHLSPKRKKRMAWALMHPMLDSIYRHHFIVSMIIAIIVIISSFLVVLRIKITEKQEFIPGILVKIAEPPADQEDIQASTTNQQNKTSIKNIQTHD